MGYSTHVFNDTPATLTGFFVQNSITKQFIVKPKTIDVIDYSGPYNVVVRIEKYGDVDISCLRLQREVKYDRSVIIKQDGEFLKIVLQKYGNDLSLEEDPKELLSNESNWCHLSLDILFTTFIANRNDHSGASVDEKIINSCYMYPKMQSYLRKELEDVENLLKLVDMANGLLARSEKRVPALPRNFVELARYQPKVLANFKNLHPSTHAINSLHTNLARTSREDPQFGLLVNFGEILTNENNEINYADLIGNIAVTLFRAFRQHDWDRKMWDDHILFLLQIRDSSIENSNRRALASSAYLQIHRPWRSHHFIWALWSIISVILIWATGDEYEFYGVSGRSRVLLITPKLATAGRMYQSVYHSSNTRIPKPNLYTNVVKVIDNAFYEIFHDSL